MACLVCRHLILLRLLIGGDFNRVYNCLNKKKPRELPKMDPENFRLVNEGVTGEAKGLFLREDGVTVPKKTFFNEIVAHDVLWWKIRAFCTTVSYVTILIPDFFPFQACENFVDTLHDLILAPVATGRMSINQCKIAWKQMIAAMHTKIHQSQNTITLAELTENEMFWKHHWTYHSPAAGRDSSEGPRSSGGVSEAERRLQSIADRAKNGLQKVGRGPRRGLNRGNNKDKGGKGANKGGNGGPKKGGGAPSPPADPRGGKGGGNSTGRNAFAKRSRRNNRG